MYNCCMKSASFTLFLLLTQNVIPGEMHICASQKVEKNLTCENTSCTCKNVYRYAYFMYHTKKKGAYTFDSLVFFLFLNYMLTYMYFHIACMHYLEYCTFQLTFQDHTLRIKGKILILNLFQTLKTHVLCIYADTLRTKGRRCS